MFNAVADIGEARIISEEGNHFCKVQSENLFTNLNLGRLRLFLLITLDNRVRKINLKILSICIINNWYISYYSSILTFSKTLEGEEVPGLSPCRGP
jgi:hypothetical protein